MKSPAKLNLVGRSKNTKTQPWCCVEQHDGYQRVQNHGEHQGDDVEQGDVREEHGDVHGTIA